MKSISYRVLSVLALLVLAQCEMFDPTVGVKNPNLTAEVVLGTASPTIGWLNGQERQAAILYNGLITILEIASDNYDNTQTFFNQQFDGLTFSFQDGDVNTLQFRIADLRQSAVVGLEDVIPADPTATDAQRAEMYFYKGWAEMLAGELFIALPVKPSSPAVSPAENLAAAIVDFKMAEGFVPSSASYKLALARAYYDLGDKANAVQKAGEAIAADAIFTRTVRFDMVNNLANTAQQALYDRGTFDDLQPLPRLDFLDPKYYARSATVASSVYIQKIEEAFLILAEAQLSDSDLASAQTSMKNTLTVVAGRTKEAFNDAAEGRTQQAPGSRPNKNSVDVRASATDPFRSGLVLSRNAGNIQVAVISGSSVSDVMVDGLTTTDDALEMVYLMRQEIFIAEGRRFADLGLRLPVSETEKLSNPGITAGNTVGSIPAFVPTDMDAISYDAEANQCTIKYNMNRILVDNKTAPEVLPFH